MKLSTEKAYQLVLVAVRVDGTLKEPFTAKDLRPIIRGWPYTGYFSFLAYNCTDKLPVETALFVRVSRGSYRIFDQIEYRQH
ncbi:hypothetical protein BRY73_23905 [Ochrobactrum sp. P6BS-III]|uniref:hypothetical protein n=1 Tax=unclassified Ochrobactrum TaxID=239106 RepID=UPI00099412B3|nr:hypothetical protein BRY73_23905 [Ochrobactrum sp. P6BS-III]